MTQRQTSFAFADLWEIVAAAVPDRTALVSGPVRLSFAALDDRAGRLAGWLAQHGVTPGSYVGVQLRNRAEHLLTVLAAYKLRAVPVNLNYRLEATELRYLYLDSGLVGVVHEADQTLLVADAAHGLDVWSLSVGDPFTSAVADHAPHQPIPRSGDDVYALYTGGTTGQPKAVEWRMEDAFFACVGGGDPSGVLGPISAPEDLLDRLLPDRTFLPAAPLVHAAGIWTSLRWLFAGAKVVLLPRFDPGEIWTAVAGERVTAMNIVGDAMARPLLDALAPGSDLTCLATVATGGASLSPATRDRMLAALPHVTVKDSYGSSETGVHGWAVHDASQCSDGFSTVDTRLLDPETRRPLPEGAAGPGLVARRGRVPLRYRGDGIKSAAAFPVLDGERYALTGDLGELASDGTLRLIGRGSQCINTGGEKVFPEELEQVLREHGELADAAVVGVPDERWGQMVVALVSPRVDGSPDTTPDEADIRAHCRGRLAAYKVPKRVLLVPAVERTVAGKVDYRWAVRTAAAGLALEAASP